MTELKKSASIQSLQVGLAIVEYVALHGQPMSFTEICEKTGTSKSNLYKYLNTLTQLGLLYRDKTTNLYSTGSKLIEYGMMAVSRENVVERVAPYLQEINRKCNETALFNAWTYNGPMVVRMANYNQGLNIGAQIGSYLPITSAAGKIFASFLPEAEIAEWKERELAILEPAQQTELLAECETIRQTLVAFASEPLVASISSIAVPIFNFQQKLLGSIILVGFNATIPRTMDHEIVTYLRTVALEISKSYGYN